MFPPKTAGPGEIVAVAGIEDITIGETLTDAEDPKPLPLIKVDDPAISMTIGINTSPLAGRVKGAKLTARQVKDRLDRELIGNVSIKVLPTQRPDAWEVQGRGELALGYSGGADAPRRLRTDRGQAAGGHQDHRRQGLRADGTHDY